MSSIYAICLCAVALAIIGVMIDTIVRVSRKSTWRSPAYTLEPIKRHAALPVVDIEDAGLDVLSPAPVNDGEWHLTA